MAETIGVIAMGEMGSGVARRLHERGATVITQLTGRTAGATIVHLGYRTTSIALPATVVGP